MTSHSRKDFPTLHTANVGVFTKCQHFSTALLRQDIFHRVTAHLPIIDLCAATVGEILLQEDTLRLDLVHK